jgi:hypothetical protein
VEVRKRGFCMIWFGGWCMIEMRRDDVNAWKTNAICKCFM